MCVQFQCKWCDILFIKIEVFLIQSAIHSPFVSTLSGGVFVAHDLQVVAEWLLHEVEANSKRDHHQKHNQQVVVHCAHALAYGDLQKVGRCKFTIQEYQPPFSLTSYRNRSIEKRILNNLGVFTLKSCK